MLIEFWLNGTRQSLRGADPRRPLLDWLREEAGLKGTKEGCAEGDCGACTVIVQDAGGLRALNACVSMLGQIAGKAVTTIEGLGPDHPVARAMVAHHGAQCGFCTPGFVMALAAAHAQGALPPPHVPGAPAAQRDPDPAPGDPALTEALGGNLCRCTGYAPILRAARAAAAAPVPEGLFAPPAPLPPPETTPEADFCRPRSLDDLLRWRAAHPGGTLVGGGTDVGLWQSKRLMDLGPVAFVADIPALTRIEPAGDRITLGAGVTIAAMRAALSAGHPGLVPYLGRFASAQIRAAATLGGNLASGSPIADTAPPLLALGAEITLASLRAGERRMALAEFLTGYRQTALAPDEVITAITLPAASDLRAWKLAKRRDQDISTVSAAFVIDARGGVITAARAAFGGMGPVAARAPALEAALIGAPLTADALAEAAQALAQDFTPLSDHRASAAYRMRAARGLVVRLAPALSGAPHAIGDIGPEGAP
ncbi:xanthine dehydrogenase small subunit [Phaeovulum vinaykumarii]|uniref:Xanthine dehydrogenase small subunit n=1 Tax=Phaeovulum vinaykumarii TaxID=407234 RepID=A0A1N7LGJ8_9RHOB|nr:FAD binding domain-containing protein [Phaeovulum vinaykumarii]SIS72891.1 xanthine dehydrogenase small subunit [Phaeovulum vinaykumarii]SOC04553.1 xanthine dehydrogenase small subunit [Phaeovulum vinaykumarii]